MIEKFVKIEEINLNKVEKLSLGIILVENCLFKESCCIYSPVSDKEKTVRIKFSTKDYEKISVMMRLYKLTLKKVVNFALSLV